MTRALWFLGLGVLLIACDQPVPGGPAPPPPVLPPPAGNRPPTAVLTVEAQGREGLLSAQLSAVGSLDPDGDSLYYTWDWGDGTRLTTTSARQSHGYVDDGAYVAVVTVTDVHGASAIASAQLTILNAEPYISALQLSKPPLPHPAPMSASLHLRFEDAGAADNPVARIDWGDGTVSTDTTHVYRSAGVYFIWVTVTDKDGATAVGGTHDALWVYDPSETGAVPGYEVLDLGTLGGDQVRPAALNNRGDVVGSATTAHDTVHAFLWRNGMLIDLNPAGQLVGAAGAINDAGWIAGKALEWQGWMPMWRDGVFTGLQSVPSDEFGTSPVKIGPTGNVLLNVRGHEWPYAVLLRNGVARQPIDASHSWANDMNAREQIVGAFAGPYLGSLSYEQRAFLWDDGIRTDLPSIGTAPCQNRPEVQCSDSEAYDINENGQIVGFAFDGRLRRAVRWEGTDLVPRDLRFGTTGSRAVAINDNGQIAGDSPDNGEAFFSDGTTVVSLGSLAGGWTKVVGMNEFGVVVGSSVTASGEVRAFVWTRERGMRDLGAGPFGARGVGSVAVAVNERGDVLGYAIPCASSYRAQCYSGRRPVRAILWRNTN